MSPSKQIPTYVYSAYSPRHVRVNGNDPKMDACIVEYVV
jgi:hypothetical protein